MKKIFIIGLFLTLTLHISAQHDMVNSATPFNSCSGSLRDPGGAGTYAANTTWIETYCSNSGNCISVNFTMFATEKTYDKLYIYDGSSTAGTLLGTYHGKSGVSGSVLPSTLNSTTGCLTFRFVSDINTVDEGWTANISCIACPTCDPPSALGAFSIGGFDATLNWTENGTATAWDIELGTSGFSPTGTPTATAVTSNPYYYSGLSSSTSYQYYVRANCGGLKSTWVGPYSFTTTALPAGSTCSDPYVLSLPFSRVNMNTAGFGDNYDQTDACGSSYLNGNDYVMTYTPVADECITIRIDNMSDPSNGSLFLLDGCPDAGGTCMAMQRGSFITSPGTTSNPKGLTEVHLTGGVTYYIVVSSDVWATGGSQTMSFNLDIKKVACPTCNDGIMNGDETNVDCGGSCSACLGATCASSIIIPSIPYRRKGYTTTGMGDNYTDTKCGTSYMNGNEIVFEYTATSADTCFTIAIEEVSKFASGLFLYDKCPSSTSANCIANSVESSGDNKTSRYIYGQRLTAGQTYYIVVSSLGSSSGNQTIDFDLNIANYCGAPDCGSNTPANDFCSTATILDNWEGFCGNTSSDYTTSPANDPGLLEFCASIENNSWFKFTADSSTSTINVYVYDCIGGAGIQIVMYETPDCETYFPVSNCWNPGTETNGSVYATNLTVGNDYYIMVDGFGGDVCNYTLQAESGIQVLPLITISNLKLNCNNDKTLLSWNTQNNSEDVVMTIQRSEDGKKFESIGSLNCKNNKTNYEYLDGDVFAKANYYRIKQQDTEGKIAYTNTIKSNCNALFTDFDVFPNPAQNKLTIKGENVQNSEINLFNSIGQILAVKSSLNENEVVINVHDIERGVYILNIKLQNQNIYRKIILN